MKTKSILICFIFSILIITSNAQWTQTTLNKSCGSFVLGGPISGQLLFAGTGNAGVYVTTDSGSTWQAKNGTTLTTSNIISLSMNGATLHAGNTTNHLARSTNVGSTWSSVSAITSDVYSLVNNGSTLYAGTFNSGIYKSIDNGANWVQVNNGFPSTYRVEALHIKNNIIYAGTWGMGVYVSNDSGATWLATNSGLTNLYVLSICSNGTHMFAGTYGGGVFVSNNNGATWTYSNTGLPIDGINSFCVIDSTVFASNVSSSGGVFMSCNNGTTWTDISNSQISMTSSLIIWGSKLYVGAQNNVWSRHLSEMHPANAGTISGITSVCKGQNSITYTVPIITYATSYTWTLPTGVTGTSSTNTITVNFGASAVSGNITVKGHNSLGDGAVSTLFITVNNVPVTPVITINTNILHSNSPTGNQWYNQNGLISGATSQNYTPLINGDYYVIVTSSGCSSNPSNTIHVTITGIEQNEFCNSIKFYPNPVTNELIIQNEELKSNIEFEIINTIGQTIFKGNLTEKTVIPTTNLVNGIYLIKLSNGKTFEFKKIVKE